MRPALEVMLKEQQAKKLIDTEKVTLGFFFMFIYKDFALRELITIALRVKAEEDNEVSQQFESLRKVFKDRVENAYQTFVRNDLTQWMNFVLAVGLFGCYSSTVSPNEADASSTNVLMIQSRNYRYLFNRYVQFFYRS